ncbi:MAG: hypothetical protein SGI77_00315 [Pirellulaceae bacterium]|nr:hypothetical protein [Pirellulaceae bacterium]
MKAAKSTASDTRRNLLWHAIRYTRSRLARDYLLESIPSASVPPRIEWIESLRNPAPFDIPILTATYERADKGTVSDEASLQEFFVRFALSCWRDTRVTDWHSTKNTELYHGSKNRRQADADAAQLRILTYLVTYGHDLETRIAAFQYNGHSWFRGFEPEQRRRLARLLLDTAKVPADRARLVSVLRDQIEPSWFLYGSESHAVKLAAIAAIGEKVANHWRSTAGYDSLREGYRVMLPIAQDEDYLELSRAASEMIRSMEIRYGEKARPEQK